MKTAVILLSLALSLTCRAQTGAGFLTSNLSITGTPTANSLVCDVGHANQLVIQTDATIGKIWICDNTTGSYAWDHIVSAILGVATTAQFAAQSFILGGCTSILTVTIAGAVVGTNSAAASPIFATAPTGNVALLNLVAWVSAANTVSVQGCSSGTLVTQPAFTARVRLY